VVERLPSKQDIVGSNPITRSSFAISVWLLAVGDWNQAGTASRQEPFV
jgi:hypothetical protein